MIKWPVKRYEGSARDAGGKRLYVVDLCEIANAQHSRIAKWEQYAKGKISDLYRRVEDRDGMGYGVNISRDEMRADKAALEELLSQ